MLSDRHPEIGGRTVACTCCRPNGGAISLQVGERAFPPSGDVAYPPEHAGETAADVAALIAKEVG